MKFEERLSEFQKKISELERMAPKILEKMRSQKGGAGRIIRST